MVFNEMKSTFDLHNPKTWNVLVVEDDLSNQELARSVLGIYYGADVTIVDNGRDALDLLQSEFNPSFILMDLSMPVMDGFTAYREIRQKDAYDGIPVIALTAHAMKAHRQKVEAAGFDGYITKPFMAKELVGQIIEILG